MLFSSTAMAIKTCTNQQTEIIRKEHGSSFRLSIKVPDNDPSLWETREVDGSTAKLYIGPYVTPDIIDSICSVDYVEKYNTRIINYVYSKDLKLVPGLYSYVLENEELANSYEEDEQEERINEEASCSIWQHVPSLISNTEFLLDDNFANSAFEILEGRSIEKNDNAVAVVSEKIASDNNLKIGDKIRVEYREELLNLGDSDKTIGKPIELEIIGIYKINFNFEPSWNTPEYDIPENYIYTSITVGELLDDIADTYLRDNSRDVFTSATFYVSNPKELDSVLQKVKKLDVINWQFFNLEIIDDSYMALLKPLETVGNFAVLMLCLSIAFGLIVLVFIVTIRIRERKRELGIYLALGYRKDEIKAQFLFEVLIICLISFGIVLILSFVLGSSITSIIVKMLSPNVSEEKYTIEYLDYGVSIMQAAGEFPNIIIQPGVFDCIVFFLICSGMMLLSTLLALTKKIKTKLIELLYY